MKLKSKRYLDLILLAMMAVLLFGMTSAVNAQPKKKDIERARKLAKTGDQLFNQKNYRGAIDKYSEAIRLFPPFPAAFFWKGYAHYYLNEFDQAVADLTQAETLRFDKPLEIYRLRWYLHFQKQSYDEALSDVIAATKLAPNDSTFTIAAGNIYRLRNQCPDAVPYYLRGMEQDKSNSDVPFFLAACYVSMGQTAGQLAAAEEALRRKTKFIAESNFFIGDAHVKQRKFEDAVPFLQTAIDVKADYYPPYGALSDIYRSRNEFEQAIEVTRRGLIAFPKDANLFTSLAWYQSLADRPREAIISAKTAISLSPDLSMAYTNLCRAYNDDGQYQAAIATCTTALKLNPGDGESYLYMARAYEFLKQSDKALDLYKKAVEGLLKFTGENPDYSDGFYLLGNAYFAIQKDADAITAYNNCLALAPRFAKARFSLGITYLMTKQKERAREQYNVLKTVDEKLAEKLRAAIDKAP
jgi:tetratricopeptide (TPR) repeat protein